MKKRMLVFGLLLIFIACQAEEYQLCDDGVTSVIDLVDCPEKTPDCPNCDDNISCTLDLCNAATDYKCQYEEIIPCDGNGRCETGEFPWSEDCPDSCDDEDICTRDQFNFALGECFYEEIVPCCGNNVCDGGETFVNCQLDCEQLLNVKIQDYQKMQYLEGAYYGNLAGTKDIYLIVEFKIHNIGINREETFNHRDQKGFYYDPFKMKIEDDSGTFYGVEYDSDLLDDYLDLTMIEYGHTVGAALLFVVPTDAEHVRLVAYDKYGSKLDVDEIY